MLQILLTLALGLVGLAAGWLQCTTSVPIADEAEKNGNTPAKTKTRLNRTGWVLIAVLGALTLAIGLKANSESSEREKQQKQSASTIQSLNNQLEKANSKIDELSVVMNKQNEVATWVSNAESLKSKILDAVKIMPKSVLHSEKEDDLDLLFSVVQDMADTFASTVQKRRSSRGINRHILQLRQHVNSYLFYNGKNLKPEFVEPGQKRVLALIDDEILALEQTLDNLITQNKPR